MNQNNNAVVTSERNLVERNAQVYLFKCMGDDLDEAEREVLAKNIVDKLLQINGIEFATIPQIRGLCHRAEMQFRRAGLRLGAYLHAVSVLMGYMGWDSVMKETEKSKGSVAKNHFFLAPALNRRVSDTYLHDIKSLSTLAKGVHVTWQKLLKILRNLSTEDMHPEIDALLLEMQMAVGIYGVTDPRGDMLFAVFHDPNVEDGYLILGEKYRPKNEVEGSYRTVAARVRTYPLSNRIMSITVPKNNCYHPTSIKACIEALRVFKPTKGAKND